MSLDRKYGTYLVEFTDGEKVVFGNNYKPWWQHAVEYIYRSKGERENIREHGWQYRFVTTVVKSVQHSNQPFCDDGGLKWCGLQYYQEVIDEVCERDKIAPFKADEMIFEPSATDKATLTKKLKEY